MAKKGVKRKRVERSKRKEITAKQKNKKNRQAIKHGIPTIIQVTSVNLVKPKK